MTQCQQPSIHGVFTPNMCPLDDSGKINEAELRRYVDWLVERGVDGLYPNGSTGEFLRFSPEERRQIVRVVCDQLGGRVPVLAGAAEANVDQTLRACDDYLACGARAVAIVAPYYYKLTQGEIEAYFLQIAERSAIDVTLYNIPFLANPIEPATVCRLADHPRIVGIKDSSGDIANMLRMMAGIEPKRPDFVFLTGWEAVMAPMLAIGCHGGTFAISGVVPEATRALASLCRAGDWVRARRLQFSLTALFDRLLGGESFPAGFRAGVTARGFDMGVSRQPSVGAAMDGPAVSEAIERLLADAQAIVQEVEATPLAASR